MYPAPISVATSFTSRRCWEFSSAVLCTVSSGAPELLELRGRELIDRVAGQVTERLGAARLLWSRVSREPAATFAARPGTGRKRPGAATGRPNVVRAGAWTDTGWPATMEGAVRSGLAAAAHVRTHTARRHAGVAQ